MLKPWTHYTNVPPPGPSAYDRLVHTLDHYDQEDVTRLILVATRNVYGEGVTTGLSLGDLIALKAKIDGLIAARRDQAQVEECRWCPSTGPMVKYHPRGQVAHIEATK